MISFKDYATIKGYFLEMGYIRFVGKSTDVLVPGISVEGKMIDMQYECYPNELLKKLLPDVEEKRLRSTLGQWTPILAKLPGMKNVYINFDGVRPHIETISTDAKKRMVDNKERVDLGEKWWPYAKIMDDDGNVIRPPDIDCH